MNRFKTNSEGSSMSKRRSSADFSRLLIRVFDVLSFSNGYTLLKHICRKRAVALSSRAGRLCCSAPLNSNHVVVAILDLGKGK